MMKTYLQIDYIDNDNKANYIQTYHNLEKAKQDLLILNHASLAIEGRKSFTLDLYAYQDCPQNPDLDTDDTLIVSNISQDEYTVHNLD